SDEDMLPEERFRLYAVCCRFPHNLAAAVTLAPTALQGVYHCRRGTDLVRVVVVSELSEAEHNAPLRLFSAAVEQVAQAARSYRQRSERTSTLLRRLVEEYQSEGVDMPYTMEEFVQEFLRDHVHELTPEERLKGLSVEEIENYLRKLRAAKSAAPESTPSQ